MVPPAAARIWEPQHVVMLESLAQRCSYRARERCRSRPRPAARSCERYERPVLGWSSKDQQKTPRPWGGTATAFVGRLMKSLQ